jgi:hypothetical protein
MDPQDELKPYRERYEDLDVRKSGRWPAAVGQLARFKRPNLAIVAIVAVFTVGAYYKSLPTTTVLVAFAAIWVLGTFGGVRES